MPDMTPERLAAITARHPNEPGINPFVREVATALREAWDEIERLGDSEQAWIDAVGHYRNLSIVLGAKPSDMLNEFDRRLCERWSEYDEQWPKVGEPSATDGVTKARAESADMWDEIERLRTLLREALEWSTSHPRQWHARVAEAIGEVKR